MWWTCVFLRNFYWFAFILRSSCLVFRKSRVTLNHNNNNNNSNNDIFNQILRRGKFFSICDELVSSLEISIGLHSVWTIWSRSPLLRNKTSFHLAFTLWFSNSFQYAFMSYINNSPLVGIPKDSSYESYLL